MIISDVQIRKLTVNEKCKALVSVTFNNAFVVHDIRVFEHNGEYYVKMPYRKKKDGYAYDVAHPTSQDMRNAIINAVLAKYFKVTKSTMNERA